MSIKFSISDKKLIDLARKLTENKLEENLNQFKLDDKITSSVAKEIIDQTSPIFRDKIGKLAIGKGPLILFDLAQKQVVKEFVEYFLSKEPGSKTVANRMLDQYKIYGFHFAKFRDMVRYRLTEIKNSCFNSEKQRENLNILERCVLQMSDEEEAQLISRI